MRRFVLLVAAVVFVTACGSGKKTAEQIQATSSTLLVSGGQPDSCGVFTQSQVAAFVGNEVAKGTDTGAGQGCYFAAQNNGNALLINLQAGDSTAKFADAKSLAAQQSSTVSAWMGIGDEAFTYAPAEGGVASAEARKGTIRIRIVLTGKSATVDMAKTILTAAIPKVP